MYVRDCGRHPSRRRHRQRCCCHRYPEGCAAPGDVQCQCNAQGPLSKLERAPSRRKINVTSKSPVGDISVVTLIRTDTTLDHSQKAEKVCTTHAVSASARECQDRDNTWWMCVGCACTYACVCAIIHTQLLMSATDCWGL